MIPKADLGVGDGGFHFLIYSFLFSLGMKNRRFCLVFLFLPFVFCWSLFCADVLGVHSNLEFHLAQEERVLCFT